MSTALDNTAATKKPDTKSNPHQPTPAVRIRVELFEPTDSRYPVFNFQKLLVVEEKKRRRRDQQSNSLEENDEAVKLAEHYEQKYGHGGVKKKKKKKTAFYNYSELAAGYDESDSFIDNTEIFDEVMPNEVETEHGGYYVNTGSLEFKNVYVSEDSEEIKSSQTRKLFVNSVLEDSDEKLPTLAVSNSEKNSPTEIKTPETSSGSSSCSEEEKEPSKPVCNPIFPVNGKNKRRLSTDSDSASSVVPTKKKKNSLVKTSIQEKMVDIPECMPSCSKDVQPMSVEESPTIEPSKSISDTIESVIYAACSKPTNDLSSSPENILVKTEQNIISLPISTDVPLSNGVHNADEELPEIIVDIIESIKTEAQIAIQNGSNIFSEQINMYLLSLQYQQEIIQFNSELVNDVLAELLSCDKKELVTQISQLVSFEEAKIIDPIKRLENAIQKVFPSVVEQYDLECNKVVDQRTVNGISNEVLKSKSGPKRPRRKFPWNDEFRAYVREIINIRSTTYSKIKRLHSVDVYVDNFINVRIKPLWPLGWMKTSIILRELKVKEKDARPKLLKKQPLQNSPMKLLSAIKIASEHKVSNSAMNKLNKWNKLKLPKTPCVSTTGSITVSAGGHTSSLATSKTTNTKQVNKSQSVTTTVTTLSNDVCPYQATITTTAINGCKPKEPEKNSVIVKSKTPTGDALDLSPNKSGLASFAFNKLKDVSVICNNTLPTDGNGSAKTDSNVSPKQMVYQPISRKQRLLQLHNAPLPDRQDSSTHTSITDLQSTKPKDDTSVSLSNKLECIKVDDKSTAKDMLSKMINESLLDNTSPLPSQFTTNDFYKRREETKSLASITPPKSDVKNEPLDWQRADQNATSKTSTNRRSSSAELAEKEAQEVIRDLLVLNQLSSCSSRYSKDNEYKKHTSSVSVYSSNSLDLQTNSPLGVIHHPAYRNSYSTTNSVKSKNELTHGTTLSIPKMSIGLKDEFLKHMVKTEEPGSRSTTDSFQKHGISHYGLIPTNAQLPDNLYKQQFYSTLAKKSNQDISHNSITYRSTNN